MAIEIFFLTTRTASESPHYPFVYLSLVSGNSGKS
ncbi:hypothetical protein SOVF_087490 [Spinacia oleracea]|nr:hypothetical protein SOVF_087490 [Spinacia oleracea]